MKVKITLDRNAFSSAKSSAVQKINRDLGSKATIAGDVITVDDGYNERQVIEILNREGVNYSRLPERSGAGGSRRARRPPSLLWPQELNDAVVDEAEAVGHVDQDFPRRGDQRTD